MSETTREPVQRYDFHHPACNGYGCCGGGSIVPYDGGFYVTYDDYVKQQEAAEQWAQLWEKAMDARQKAEDERDAAVESLTDSRATAYGLRARLAAATKCLAFFRSVILSGEQWSETCEQEYRAAVAAETQGEKNA